MKLKQYYKHIFTVLKGGLCVLLFNACSKERLPQYAETIEKTGEVDHKTENLVIVTLDGFRWQEVFQGADSTLLFNKKYVKNQEREDLKESFWKASEIDRKESLMPFLWSTIKQKGQLYGNRELDNKINVANPYWKSYPGYNEIFTGYVNPEIKENNYGASPDYNILEFLNEQKGMKNEKVAAFTRASSFTERLNVDRSNLYVVAGVEKNTSYQKDSVNETSIQSIESLPVSNITDLKSELEQDRLVYGNAKSYLKNNHPKVLYISFLATDRFGHKKKYGSYLESGFNTDVMLQDLWSFIQTNEQYKDKTTLFITTDHGRGIGKKWYTHGAEKAEYSDQTWLAVIGPDTPAEGEMETNIQLYNKQFAQTFASFLGYRIQGVSDMGTSIKNMKQ